MTPRGGCFCLIKNLKALWEEEAAAKVEKVVVVVVVAAGLWIEFSRELELFRREWR